MARAAPYGLQNHSDEITSHVYSQTPDPKDPILSREHNTAVNEEGNGNDSLKLEQ